ncbi:hypothetical protein LUZ63_011409 [Rhynchospora breviuscula]|uniref:KIB1-4 beta-propeller domain-containing protein n=1 Tax=Rhynchospora breviuscula TaxID=2022672 RepID=A0A9Q0CIR2_9POAL|nr:hypothetical protein LUZ63_011409 [Rhynchospora breviuscula]
MHTTGILIPCRVAPCRSAIRAVRSDLDEASSSSEFRDWAHLLPEIVELISSKVKSTTNYVRFRAVCSPWRSASYPKPRHHLPPQLPWLMFPNSSCDPTCVYFDDIWESKRRKFYLPEAKDMVYIASYCGWFLVIDYSIIKVFLLNPLTRARIRLPSFNGRVKCLGDDKSGDMFYHYSCSFTGTKMTFSANLTDPNCLIMVFFPRYDVICCRVGDLYWTWVTYRAGLTKITDATYYNRQFYLLYEESLMIIESDKPEERIVPMPELKAVRKCFLEGKTGVFVLVVRRKV